MTGVEHILTPNRPKSRPRSRARRRPDVPTTYWGKPAWSFIDAAVQGYPESKPNREEMDAMKRFLLSLATVIPCSKCRRSYKEYTENNPVTREVLSSRATVASWIEGYKGKLGAKPDNRTEG